jgi:hypothetical protein
MALSAIESAICVLLVLRFCNSAFDACVSDNR